VQHGPQRPDVASGVGVPTLELLGRHVVEGADERTLAGQSFGGRAPGLCLGHGMGGRRPGSLRQSEIEQLHAGPGEHDVAGLEVAVGDAAPVRLGECLGNLRSQTVEVAKGNWTSLQPRSEGFALDQLHHEKSRPVRGFLESVQRRDAGVVQRGQQPGFARQSCQPERVVAQLRRQELDGHGPPEAGVFCAVDLAHPAGADLLDDAIVQQGVAGANCHGECPPTSDCSPRPPSSTGTSRPRTSRSRPTGASRSSAAPVSKS
jgi:hypothetical protein